MRYFSVASAAANSVRSAGPRSTSSYGFAVPLYSTLMLALPALLADSTSSSPSSPPSSSTRTSASGRSPLSASRMPTWLPTADTAGPCSVNTTLAFTAPLLTSSRYTAGCRSLITATANSTRAPLLSKSPSLTTISTARGPGAGSAALLLYVSVDSTASYALYVAAPLTTSARAVALNVALSPAYPPSTPPSTHSCSSSLSNVAADTNRTTAPCSGKCSSWSVSRTSSAPASSSATAPACSTYVARRAPVPLTTGRWSLMGEMVTWLYTGTLVPVPSLTTTSTTRCASAGSSSVLLYVRLRSAASSRTVWLSRCSRSLYKGGWLAFDGATPTRSRRCQLSTSSTCSPAMLPSAAGATASCSAEPSTGLTMRTSAYCSCQWSTSHSDSAALSTMNTAPACSTKVADAFAPPAPLSRTTGTSFTDATSTARTVVLRLNAPSGAYVAFTSCS